MKKDKNRPLRKTANRVKGIYEAYVKNQDKKEKNKDLEMDNQKEYEDTLTQEELSKKLDEKLSEENSNEPENGDTPLSEVESLQAELASLREQLLRKSAEMENMKRRLTKEKQDIIERGSEGLLQKFLELPDDMDNALEAAKKAGEQGVLVNGVKLIHKKVEKLLSENGVNKMDINPGDEFDVEYHEALMAAPSNEVEEGHIIQVVQTGYLLKDRVLRHAKVITSQGGEG
ncbi:MAG: hypothetical protein Kapaf2KO_10650 [Candidatus Kapaibacteriales bacterium]